MNWVVISLAIIILFLFYILYRYYTNTATTVSKLAYLTTSQPAITTLINSSSARYAYGIWIYVNNLNSGSSSSNNPNIIFQRSNNIILSLDNNSTNLYCWLNDNVTPSTSPTIVTNNFPLQKWSQVIVNVDNQFIDYYLNGKLIKSEKKTNTLTTPSDISKGNSNVYLGNSANTKFVPFDAYVTNLQYWSNPINPQDAWNSYLSGNGQNSYIGWYNLNLQVLKDNMLQTSVSLY
jgi:hypothetical protein